MHSPCTSLISTELAFGAFALITLAGALLSLRHEAVGVAVLSIFGGFATPLLLQDELPDQRWLLLYVLVLDVGVLALAGFRNWRWFTLLAWAGSLILFGFWHWELEPSLALAQIGLTIIFLIFVAATIAFHLLRRQTAGVADLALVTLNAAGYYGISYALMNEPYDDWMAGFTALVAVFYVALGAACRLRGPEQLNLTLFSAGLAVVFAVLAVPIQLGGPWISLAWGVEGLVLIWLSFPLRMRELRWAGYAMFVVNALWLLTRDTPDALDADLTPFLNEYMISYAASIVLPVLAGWYLHLRRADLEPGEERAIPLFAIRAAIFAAAVIPVQVDGVWIPIAWAVEALLALALSVRLRMVELRWFGYGLLAAMLVRLVSIDTFDVDPWTFQPVANLRFLAFAAGIAALYLSGWMAFRFPADLDATTPASQEPGADATSRIPNTAGANPAVHDTNDTSRTTTAGATARTPNTADANPAVHDTDSATPTAAATTPTGHDADSTTPTGRPADAMSHADAATGTPRQPDAATSGPAPVDNAAAPDPRQQDSSTREANVDPAANAPPAADAATSGPGRPADAMSHADAATGTPRQPDAATSGPGRAADAMSRIAQLDARAALPALLALANLLTLWLLSWEVVDSANSDFFALSRDASENVASLGLSLLWAVYAAVLLVLGVLRRLRWVRVGGLALLALPVVKLFAYDSGTLEQEYRVIAFIALGLLLLAGGLLYQRYSTAVRGFLLED